MSLKLPTADLGFFFNLYSPSRRHLTTARHLPIMFVGNLSPLRIGILLPQRHRAIMFFGNLSPLGIAFFRRHSGIGLTYLSGIFRHVKAKYRCSHLSLKLCPRDSPVLLRANPTWMDAGTFALWLPQVIGTNQ